MICDGSWQLRTRFPPDSKDMHIHSLQKKGCEMITSFVLKWLTFYFSCRKEQSTERCGSLVMHGKNSVIWSALAVKCMYSLPFTATCIHRVFVFQWENMGRLMGARRELQLRGHWVQPGWHCWLQWPGGSAVTVWGAAGLCVFSSTMSSKFWQFSEKTCFYVSEDQLMISVRHQCSNALIVGVL